MNTIDIKHFEATKPFLLAIDSDGCVFDTMALKHRNYFGPTAVEVFQINDSAQRFMEVWELVNLTSLMRGINRFQALYNASIILNSEGVVHSGNLHALKRFLETSKTLSNEGLESFMKSNPDSGLELVMKWSETCNERIHSQMELHPPFEGVHEMLDFAKGKVDVLVCSAANRQALNKEWGAYGLLEKVSVVAGQEIGSKATQIEQMAKKGYTPENILMVGDAPGDRDAALANEARFFPITPGQEVASWRELKDTVFPKFLKKEYSENLMNEYWEKYAACLQSVELPKEKQ